ncbi:membrane protein insertion efficiency factor YidD [Zavarzinella formosa]|uniref:membrane protein insertion efficiency factor YidD n=1 Tax=Zavarzinella formosa TaxID=360055 RepID=UPI000314AECA|nr:membrane protein insertion efficiency factor YidD [Zavarzinella formosa]
MFRKLLTGLIVLLVRGYQRVIRPVLPPSCIYQPGCSEYMILSVRKYGPLFGTAKGVWRVCRCHPFNKGGEDWP